MINPPKLEICFEGYNTDQTDFYIGQLIERINILESANDAAKERLSYLETENKQLRGELLSLIRQHRSDETDTDEKSGSESEKRFDCADDIFNESKNEVNSAIREGLASLKAELSSVKEFIKNN